MLALLVAVPVSVASCWCYAAAAVRQERLASEAAGSLARAPWWRAVVLTCLGAGLHVLALRFGPLSVVQPLGALTLVFAVPLSAAVGGRPRSPAERRGAVLTVAGLAGLLLLSGSAAPHHVLGTRTALWVGGVTVLLVVLVTSTRAGLAYAAASGVASGVASALTQTVAVSFGSRGWAAALTPTAALVAVLAITGLLLSQAGYRVGLGAPLAVLTIANPLAAGTIGIALLGERFTAGVPGTALALACAGLAARGVAVLAVNGDAPLPDEAEDGPATVGEAGRLGHPGGRQVGRVVQVRGDRTAVDDPARGPRDELPGQAPAPGLGRGADRELLAIPVVPLDADAGQVVAGLRVKREEHLAAEDAQPVRDDRVVGGYPDPGIR